MSDAVLIKVHIDEIWRGGLTLRMRMTLVRVQTLIRKIIKMPVQESSLLPPQEVMVNRRFRLVSLSAARSRVRRSSTMQGLGDSLSWSSIVVPSYTSTYASNVTSDSISTCTKCCVMTQYGTGCDACRFQTLPIHRPIPVKETGLLLLAVTDQEKALGQQTRLSQ